MTSKKQTLSACIAVSFYLALITMSGCENSAQPAARSDQDLTNLWGYYHLGSPLQNLLVGEHFERLSIYPLDPFTILTHLTSDTKDENFDFHIRTCTLRNDKTCVDGTETLFSLLHDGKINFNRSEFVKTKISKNRGKHFQRPRQELSLLTTTLSRQACPGPNLNGFWFLMRQVCATSDDNVGDSVFVRRPHLHKIHQEGSLVVICQIYGNQPYGTLDKLGRFDGRTIEHLAYFSMIGEMQMGPDQDENVTLITDYCLCRSPEICSALDAQMPLAHLFGEMAEFGTCLELGGMAKAVIQQKQGSDTLEP